MKKIIIAALIIAGLNAAAPTANELETTATHTETVDSTLFPYYRTADSTCGIETRYTDYWCEVATDTEY